MAQVIQIYTNCTSNTIKNTVIPIRLVGIAPSAVLFSPFANFLAKNTYICNKLSLCSTFCLTLITLELSVDQIQLTHTHADRQTWRERWKVEESSKTDAIESRTQTLFAHHQNTQTTTPRSN